LTRHALLYYDPLLALPMWLEEGSYSLEHSPLWERGL
jgi:hypothetical protein